jgi:hypothetical protein
MLFTENYSLSLSLTRFLMSISYSKRGMVCIYYRAAAKRSVENRKQRHSNKLRVSTQLEATLDQANRTITLRTADILSGKNARTLVSMVFT